jgi:hypothetical protein
MPPMFAVIESKISIRPIKSVLIVVVVVVAVILHRPCCFQFAP